MEIAHFMELGAMGRLAPSEVEEESMESISKQWWVQGHLETDTAP